MRAAGATGAERRGGEDRVAVGAEADEGDVAEVEQARPADRYVEPEREDRVEQTREADREEVDVAGEQSEGHTREHGQAQPLPPAQPGV